MSNLKSVTPILLSASLTACGGAVPELAEPGSPITDSHQMVTEIARTVYAELETAVGCSIQETKAKDIKFTKEFEDNWGVLTTLDLTIDEATSLMSRRDF
jgi:hypothetical protein